MNRDPVVLVDEFLRSEDPRLRKNAIVALGTIGGQASTERLIEIALRDTDPQVREAAQTELIALLGTGEQALLDIYEKSRHDKQRRNEIYALLGRLRACGARVKAPRDAMRPAFLLFFTAYPTRGWKFYFRTLPASMGGALATLLIMQLILGVVARSADLSGGVNSDVVTNGVIGAILGVIAAQLAALFTTAYPLHVSTRRGLLVEILYAVGPPFLSFGSFVLLYALQSGKGEAGVLWPAAILFVVLIASSRALTILASGTAKSRFRNVLISTATGTGGTMIVLTTIIAPLARIMGARDLSETWAIFLPMCGALSAAFAAIDARVATTVRPVLRVILSRLIILAAATVPVILIVSMFTARRAANEQLQRIPIGARLRSVVPSHQSVPIDGIPFRVELQVVHNCGVRIIANDYTDTLRLRRRKGGTIAEGTYGVSSPLTPGTYDLYHGLPASTVTLHSEDALNFTLGALAHPLSGQVVPIHAIVPTAHGEKLLSIDFSAVESLNGLMDTDTMMTVDTSGPVTDTAAYNRTSEANARLETGLKSAAAGQIESALADFNEARRIDPNIPITAAQWNGLCWSGSVHRQEKLVVDGACETAVTLDTQNIEYLDSRGLARALTGRNKEAIADLTRFVQGTANLDKRAQREKWIKALRAGKNPFTEAEMSLVQREVPPSQ
jgi:hypothetical protein